MIEIILLFFLSKKMGDLAIEKGLSPGRWKLYTVLSWIVFQLLGTIVGVMLFGFDKNNIWGLMGFAIVSAFGGYLFVRKRLENKETPPVQ